MDDHAADGGFAGFLHRPPFDAVPAMEAMLRRAGYRGIGTTQRVAEVRYASPDAWWEASWNQAPALFWEKIPEPLPPSAPAARPGCSRPGAASSTANPLNALRSAGYAMLLSLTSSAALKAGDSSRDLRSRCRFTVHWPGNPEASPCSHGMPCRSSVSGDAVPA